MKKIILAGVAALSIASAAHATDTTLPLTDPLIGHHCDAMRERATASLMTTRAC